MRGVTSARSYRVAGSRSYNRQKRVIGLRSLETGGVCCSECSEWWMKTVGSGEVFRLMRTFVHKRMCSF